MKRKFKKAALFILGIQIVLITGCSFFHMSAMTVTGHSPDGGIIPDPGAANVSLTFSAEPDEISVEQAFSLTEDGAFMPGGFSWSGNTMTFTPFESMEPGYDYLVELTTDAEDKWGNSLDKPFYLSFTSRTETNGPEILSIVPADGAGIDTLGPMEDFEIIIEFSEAVDEGSLYKAFSISPHLRGYFTWPDELHARYNLLDPVLWNVNYTITVGTSLCDLQGNRLTSKFTSEFTAAVDEDPPEILSVEYIWNNGTGDVNETMAEWDPELAGSEITSGFRRDGKIRLTIADESGLDKDAVEAACTILPDLKHEYEWTNDGTNDRLEIIINPDDVIWGGTYQLRVSDSGSGVTDIYGNTLEGEHSWYFRADAAWSKPPELTAIYSTTEPLADINPASPPADYYQEIAYDLDPLDITAYDDPDDEGFIDYYFSIGPDAGHSILLKSTFTAFSFEKMNNCTTIGGIFKIEIFTAGDTILPAPALTLGSADRDVLIRVHLKIHDNTDVNGLVKFIVNGGLEDTAGNIMTDEYSVMVEK